MSTYSKGFCINCPYFATFSLGLDHQMQLCRKDPVSVTLVSADPESDFCSHHPLRRVHVLAEKAMVGILAHPDAYYPDAHKLAYECANGMIAEAAKRLGVTAPDFIERQRENPE
jgi:hypothetical protein